MDPAKLLQDLVDKEFTDVEIFLADKKECIHMFLHKLVLVFSSDYFKTMFKFGAESNQKQITINVDDAKIAYDLIMSFYGVVDRKYQPTYPRWLYYILMYRCRKFFCLDTCVNVFYDIELPTNEAFDMFLTVVEDFEYMNDKKLIKTIKNNIPPDYPIWNFDKKFIKILGNECDIRMAYANSNKLYFGIFGENVDSFKTIKMSYTSGHIYTISFFPDNKRIAAYCANKMVEIWDLEKIECLSTINIGEFLSDQNKMHFQCIPVFDPSGKKMIVCENVSCVRVCENVGCVRVWDMDTYKLEKMFYCHNFYSHYGIFSNDGTKYALTCNYDIQTETDKIYKSNISVWQIETFEKLLEFDFDDSITILNFCPSGKRLFLCDCNTKIHIYSLENTRLVYVHTIDTDLQLILGLEFSSDGTKFFCHDHNKVIVWNSRTFELLGRIGPNTTISNIKMINDHDIIITHHYGTIELWNIDTFEHVKTITYYPNNSKTILSTPIHKEIDKKIFHYLDNVDNVNNA